MRTIVYAASIALLSATACFAQGNNLAGSTGAADQQNSAAIRSNEPANPQAMSSQNTSGQTKADEHWMTPPRRRPRSDADPSRAKRAAVSAPTLAPIGSFPRPHG